MFALIQFSGHRLHSVEVADTIELLQAIVEKREGGSVTWHEDAQGLAANSLAGPLISYRIQQAAVR